MGKKVRGHRIICPRARSGTELGGKERNTLKERRKGGRSDYRKKSRRRKRKKGTLGFGRIQKSRRWTCDQMAI